MAVSKVSEGSDRKLFQHGTGIEPTTTSFSAALVSCYTKRRRGSSGEKTSGSLWPILCTKLCRTEAVWSVPVTSRLSDFQIFSHQLVFLINIKYFLHRKTEMIVFIYVTENPSFILYHHQSHKKSKEFIQCVPPLLCTTQLMDSVTLRRQEIPTINSRQDAAVHWKPFLVTTSWIWLQWVWLKNIECKTRSGSTLFFVYYLIPLVFLHSLDVWSEVADSEQATPGWVSLLLQWRHRSSRGRSNMARPRWRRERELFECRPPKMSLYLTELLETRWNRRFPRPVLFSLYERCSTGAISSLFDGEKSTKKAFNC